MRIGRCLGYLGLGMLIGARSLSAAEPAQPARKAAASAEAPPFTAPPPATPQLLYRMDLARMARGIVLGSNVSFDSLDTVASTVNAGLRADTPLIGANSKDTTRPAIAWHPVTTTTLKRGPAAPDLNARGWFKIDKTSCVINAPTNRPPLEICGSIDAMLAYADVLEKSVGPLPGNDAFELEVDLRSVFFESLEPWRTAIVGQVDDWIRSPALSHNTSLRLGLFDLAYSFSSGVTDMVLDLGRQNLSLAFDSRGARYRIPLRPRDGSALEKALQRAPAKPAPRAFWELSDKLDSAWFGSSNLLASLLTPGPRAMALLAAAHAASAPSHERNPQVDLLDAVQQVASSCVVPNRALLLVRGELPANGQTARESAKPPAVFVPVPTEKAARYESYALEDPKSACANSLTAFAKLYAKLPTENAAANVVELLKPEKGMPVGSVVARIGVGKEQHYAAITTRAGFSWLSWADTLPALSAAVQALTAPPAHRLSTVPELAELAKEPALFGGFGRTIEVPGVISASGPPARVPWLLRQDGTGWSYSGTMDARFVRQAATQFMLNVWNVQDWSRFDSNQRNAFTHFFDSACRLGNGHACNALGIRYADGEGLNKDLDRAHELLALGCAAGEGVACINSAFYGASPSEQLARSRRGCELKSALSCAWYGKWLLESHTLEDHPKGIKNLEFACDEASGLGCWQLADAYEEGTGVAKDEQKSRELYTRSCNLRFAAGCIALGNLLAKAPADGAKLKLALEAYEVGCKLDARSGCYVLGYAYAKGFSGEKDMKTARVHWTHACDAGHAEACRALAETTEAP